MQVLINVRLFDMPYTNCYISKDLFQLSNDFTYKYIGIKNSNKARLEVQIGGPENASQRLKLHSNALFLQPFIKECINSNVYRVNVMKNLCELSGNATVYLTLILKPPDKEIIDYEWNMRLLQLVWMRFEIDKAFSWLSTLGGAYSALGDYFDNCAVKAGEISISQYRLSKMLGDESLAARSRLYSALALSQKGNLKVARNIVRNVAAFAKSTKDVRLNRMCQGVWAKLKYLRQLHVNEMKINNTK